MKYIDNDDIKISFTASVIFLWAFFGPESFGHWIGNIFHAIKATTGV